MAPDSVHEGLLPVAIRTLGCKVNRIESDEIASGLLGRGVAIGDEDDAAVIVVNTCTVTGEADAKARKAVRQALARKGQPVVVVTGCLAALDAEGLRGLSPRVVVEPDKQRVPAAVAGALGAARVAEDAAALSATAWGEGFRARAMLKVQDGCDSFCTYCIVPYARGVPRSVALDDVRPRAQALVDAGATEVVLSGINVGRYRDGDSDLADVITALAEAGVRRVRLSSIEPLDLTSRLLEVMAGEPAFCAHLHVPLQSGSDRVLVAMGRSYTAEEYVERIAAARDSIDRLAVTTDVIAGFPGESDVDHAQTVALVRQVGFTKLHVFRYSARDRTPAARMPQVAAQVRARRAAELRSLGDELRTDYLRGLEGCSAEVLVESVEGRTATGTTREYVRVKVEAGDVAAGATLPVVLGGVATEPMPATLLL